ncbi:hypothetical protein [Maribacter sp. 2-571]|uniref:hypothetical protein n=1 Tax=Maribacter sp. 2-571 TaxID=3417569 RepID=UPI003D34936C
MKIILRSAAIAALVMMASCGKDDDGGSAGEMAEQAELLEQTPLEANTIADNVMIQGATKEEGAPPTPNGAISMDISEAGKTAFLNEGFTIPVSSDGDITGAYLRFKANDGTVSDSYYDIDINANQVFDKAARKTVFQRAARTLASKVDEANLDIDFSAQIEPGTFCYEICVYDAEGNISDPSEVCVTVESWGGNAAVVGKWSLVKEEYTYAGTTETYNIGEPDCDTWTTSCANEQELEITVCYTQEYGTLEIKADGSYSIDFKGADQDYDDAAASECELVYTEDSTYRYQSTGNWAYVTAENRLTLVEYGYTVEEDGETEVASVENGEAELLYDGKAEVNGNSFVLIEVSDYDSSVEDISKFYFEK